MAQTADVTRGWQPSDWTALAGVAFGSLTLGAVAAVLAAPAVPAAPTPIVARPATPAPLSAIWVPAAETVPTPAAVEPTAEVPGTSPAALEPSPAPPAAGGVSPALPAPKLRGNSEAQLLAQLPQAREVSLPGVPFVTAGGAMRRSESLLSRPELAGLPVRRGADSETPRGSALVMHELAARLRGYLSVSAGVGALVDPQNRNPDLHRIDAAYLRGLFLNGPGGWSAWARPEGVAVVEHVLTAEHKGCRRLAVALFGLTPGPEAGRALARRAVFDADAGVRSAAVRELAKRDAGQYIGVLVEAFRHPWPAAAEHAALALVALGAAAAVPDLERLAGEADPAGGRELVRLDHSRNCQTCHAASFSAVDPLRGMVPGASLAPLPPPPPPPPPPEPSPRPQDRRDFFDHDFGKAYDRARVKIGASRLEMPGANYQQSTGDRPRPASPPPPPVGYYGGGERDSFVRADVTFLRQDFSAFLTVGGRPRRFDFLVRDRPAAATAGRASPQREAARYALRQLTGKADS